MQDEKIIVIDINLTRGLVVLLALTLLMATFVGYLAWGQRDAIASSPQVSFGYAQDRPFDYAQDRPLAASTGMRQYYLTVDFYRGADADNACATGYHMASLWEILGPSNLRYNPDLGYTRDDSGQGPPTFSGGWVRTGYSSSTYMTPGRANCNAWTSSNDGDTGTRALLTSDWTGGLEDIHVWDVSALSCAAPIPVWCVED